MSDCVRCGKYPANPIRMWVSGLGTCLCQPCRLDHAKLRGEDDEWWEAATVTERVAFFGKHGDERFLDEQPEALKLNRKYLALDREFMLTPPAVEEKP